MRCDYGTCIGYRYPISQIVLRLEDQGASLNDDLNRSK